jgi:hypothetical protein
VDKIRKKIKCKDTLWLLDEIVRSPGGNTNTPIGNYLSQYFSNIYLSDFDHWIKEEKRMRYYIRYCDDGVILHGNKNTLLKLYADIDNYLSDNLKLTLNPKTKIIDVGKQGIDFLGYRCFRGYTLLRKQSALKFKKRIKTIETYSPDSHFVINSIMSYIGWLSHCDSYNILSKYVFENGIILSKLETASENLKINNLLIKKYGGNHGRIYKAPI